MVDYAIGDVQGCYDQLMHLLERLDFDEQRDTLWFVGDLINRGPHSLSVLRFIYNLPIPANITLGNHDLYLIKCLFTEFKPNNKDDTILSILNADDGEELGHWLRKQPLLIHNPSLNVVMTHAGIAPMWTLTDAKKHAYELEQVLANDDYQEFLSHMYGNEPALWSDTLTGFDRLRTICNYLTRMRFCDQKGRLNFNYKGTIQSAPPHLYPWYEVPNRQTIPGDIVFGHWAALQGQCPIAHIFAIDTGCLWGGALTALRLQDKKRFTVPGMATSCFGD